MERQYSCPESAAAGTFVLQCASEGLMTGPQLFDHNEVDHKFPVPRKKPRIIIKLNTFLKNESMELMS
jgi:hypothetical protein